MTILSPDGLPESLEQWLKSSDSGDLVTASERREFVFWERAWWLKRQGKDVSSKAQTDRAEGIHFHEQRARTASEGATLCLVILFVLAIIALWFLKERWQAHH